MYKCFAFFFFLHLLFHISSFWLFHVWISSYIWKRTGDTKILAITLPWGIWRALFFFQFFFQSGESFTRGERLENLSLMKMKDWATQNTRRCAFQRGYSLICDYNCYGISNKCSFYPMRPAKYSLRKITQNLFLPQQDYLFELDWTDISFFL